MEKQKRQELIANISSIGAFLITYVLCAILGWVQVMQDMFTVTNENVGEAYGNPVAYTVFCLLFYAVMFALVILGVKFKNKLMVLLPACYELLLILSVVLLGVTATGGLTNETMLDVVTHVITFVLIPSFGFMWSLPLVVVVIIFIALLALTIVGLVKVFKPNRKK